jgi:hypothetical protein
LAQLLLESFSFGSGFTDKPYARPECGAFVSPMALECSREVWLALSACDVATVASVSCRLENQKVLGRKIYMKDKIKRL